MREPFRRVAAVLALAAFSVVATVGAAFGVRTLYRASADRPVYLAPQADDARGPFALTPLHGLDARREALRATSARRPLRTLAPACGRLAEVLSNTPRDAVVVVAATAERAYDAAVLINWAFPRPFRIVAKDPATWTTTASFVANGEVLRRQTGVAVGATAYFVDLGTPLADLPAAAAEPLLRDRNAALWRAR